MLISGEGKDGKLRGKRIKYDFEPPKSIADHCVIDGDILLASENIASDPIFRNYESYLRKANVVVGTEVLPFREFAERKEHARTGKKIDLLDESFTAEEAMKFFGNAAKNGASDIHIISHDEHHAMVKFRINGRLRVQENITDDSARSLISTIYNSLCDGERDSSFVENKFQDGMITKREKLPRGVHGIRVLSGGHSEGLFMVLRLLYDQTESISGSLRNRLEGLGYSNSQATMFKHMISRPSGIVLIAGPTGSGKSTTLKHLMESVGIARDDINLMSVEDPVEYPMDRVVQLNVACGYSKTMEKYEGSPYANTIRACMRADPDWIMVGEIRDRPSAVAALYGAQTGHPIMTTIHANSAWSILHRLIGLIPLEEFPDPLEILADPTVLTGLVYQQLVLATCPHCSVSLAGNEKLLDKDLLARINTVVPVNSEEYSGIKLAVKGQECEACQGLGIIGRTVVAEVIALDPHMLGLMKEEGVEAARLLWRQNYPGQTRLQHALRKMTSGSLDPRHLEEKLGQLDFDVLLEDGQLEEHELIGIREKVTKAQDESTPPAVTGSSDTGNEAKAC